MLLVGFIGAVVALGLMWVSPGNHVRLTDLQHSHIGIVALAKLSVYWGARTLARSLWHGAFSWPFTLVGAGVLGFAVAGARLSTHATAGAEAADMARIRLALVGVPVATCIAFVLSVSPTVYAVSEFPYWVNRALVIPTFVLACGVVAWGFLGGYVWRTPLGPGATEPRRYRILLAVAVLAALCGPLLAGARILAYATMDRAYAAAWDAQDRTLRQAAARGDKEADVAALPAAYLGRTELESLEPDSRFWVNRCVAQYYGLQAVRVR